ncbi:MAG: hypothetical protein JWN04_1373 [Myxococcaceae bacterium]|nr:hypothetical protein [Myxococcaceae bacterium]
MTNDFTTAYGNAWNRYLSGPGKLDQRFVRHND